MIEYVKLLEGKSNIQRKNIIIDLLSKKGYKFALERYLFLGAYHENIIVTIGKGKKRILIVTHYDVVDGSPGANDNASTIAVVFDLLNRLKRYKPQNTIEFVIFGDEEKGCIGSRAYVKKHGIKDIIAVYDMELVGNGDIIGIWPVTKSVRKSRALLILKKAVKKLGYYCEEAGSLPIFFADYEPFREAGLKDSFCISVVPKEEKDAIRKFAEMSKAEAMLKSMFNCITIPRFFQLYHSSEDKSKYLSERALRMTSNVLYSAITELDSQQ
jgi:aminopeptidase-like protein